MLLPNNMNSSHSSYATHMDTHDSHQEPQPYTQSPIAHGPTVTPSSSRRMNSSQSSAAYSPQSPRSQIAPPPHSHSPHSPLSYPGLNMTLPMKRREERQRKLLRQRQEQLQRQIQTRPSAPLPYYDDAEYTPPPARGTSFTPQPYDEEPSPMCQMPPQHPTPNSHAYDDYCRTSSPRSPHTLVINQSYSYDNPTPPSPIRPLPVRPRPDYHHLASDDYHRVAHSFESSSPTPENLNVISPNHRSRSHHRFPSESSYSLYEYRDYRPEHEHDYSPHSYHKADYHYPPLSHPPPPPPSTDLTQQLPLVTDSFDTHEKDPVLTEDPNAPVIPPSSSSIIPNMSEVNCNDVLCGRGGGTNSQVGNRRFRKLVQDYQPIYLTARRKEKPVIARNIVRMIRQRGGRFLKKDDANESLWEVGDERAEAKTSQALREGLDVRASKGGRKEVVESVVRERGERMAGEMFVETTRKRDLEVVLRSEEERRLFGEFVPPRAKIQRREEVEEGGGRGWEYESVGV